ncbi:protein of unknown function [Taphrina deformans PYCC 5710]|uniref:Uncharacterized protein n=1 Tax=Taphrina deformans (strain PYCC 5710 / ATCC 11124 / CBS 356.35 / IMI 108563 / JCM 9778 / NBRC 8474) TaxID=1097556 RepID=R4XD90_TAPDE|nr:protein of unknown function [Taphrina deformans PYCC 5710]|eukprot:CCG83795.1 protein of unknown function [Taphrina deformans PYCC 5710]
MVADKSRWSFKQSAQLLSELIFIHRLEASPSDFPALAELLGRDEGVVRSRYIRLQKVLRAYGAWSSLETIGAREHMIDKQALLEEIAVILRPHKGHIWLLDYYYAAIRVTQSQFEKLCLMKWIPTFPLGLLQSLNETEEVETLITTEELMTDEKGLRIHMEAAIEQIRKYSGPIAAHDNVNMDQRREDTWLKVTKKMKEPNLSATCAYTQMQKIKLEFEKAGIWTWIKPILKKTIVKDIDTDLSTALISQKRLINKLNMGTNLTETSFAPAQLHTSTNMNSNNSKEVPRPFLSSGSDTEESDLDSSIEHAGHAAMPVTCLNAAQYTETNMRCHSLDLVPARSSVDRIQARLQTDTILPSSSAMTNFSHDDVTAMSTEHMPVETKVERPDGLNLIYKAVHSGTEDDPIILHEELFDQTSCVSEGSSSRYFADLHTTATPASVNNTASLSDSISSTRQIQLSLSAGDSGHSIENDTGQTLVAPIVKLPMETVEFELSTDQLEGISESHRTEEMRNSPTAGCDTEKELLADPSSSVQHTSAPILQAENQITEVFHSDITGLSHKPWSKQSIAVESMHEKESLVLGRLAFQAPCQASNDRLSQQTTTLQQQLLKCAVDMRISESHPELAQEQRQCERCGLLLRSTNPLKAEECVCTQCATIEDMATSTRQDNESLSSICEKNALDANTEVLNELEILRNEDKVGSPPMSTIDEPLSKQKPADMITPTRDAKLIEISSGPHRRYRSATAEHILKLDIGETILEDCDYHNKRFSEGAGSAREKGTIDEHVSMATELCSRPTSPQGTIEERALPEVNKRNHVDREEAPLSLETRTSSIVNKRKLPESQSVSNESIESQNKLPTRKRQRELSSSPLLEPNSSPTQHSQYQQHYDDFRSTRLYHCLMTNDLVETKEDRGKESRIVGSIEKRFLRFQKKSCEEQDRLHAIRLLLDGEIDMMDDSERDGILDGLTWLFDESGRGDGGTTPVYSRRTRRAAWTPSEEFSLYCAATFIGVRSASRWAQVAVEVRTRSEVSCLVHYGTYLPTIESIVARSSDRLEVFLTLALFFRVSDESDAYARLRRKFIDPQERKGVVVAVNRTPPVPWRESDACRLVQQCPFTFQDLTDSMVTIREARVSDIPTIVDIRVDAFQTPLARWINAGHPVNRLHAGIDLTRELIACPDDMHLVACDGAGKVLGFCDGTVQSSSSSSSSSSGEETSPHAWSLRRLEASLAAWETWLIALPTVLRGRRQRAETAEKVEVFSRALDSSRTSNTKSLDRFVYLKLLIVDPASQGQGVGARLLQHCQDLARRLDVPLYLESSQRGYPFYKKVGFSDFGDPCVISYEGRTLETLPTVLWRPQS